MSATLGDTTFFEEETHAAQRSADGRRLLHGPAGAAGACRILNCRWPRRWKASSPTAKRRCMWSISRNWRPRRSAQDFTEHQRLHREERAALANALEGYKFSSPYGPDIKNGCGTALVCIMPGCCRSIRVLIEQLRARRVLLKIICGTDTLGVGINVPIRTVLFTRLCKYDGQKGPAS